MDKWINRREFLGILWTLLASSLLGKNISQQVVQALTESEEGNKEKIADITANLFFSFCQEKIDEEKKFTYQESVIVLDDLKKYFINHPFCTVKDEKLTLLLNKEYVDTMAQSLMHHFTNKLNWWAKTAVGILGKENTRWVLARCLKNGRFCNPKQVLIRDLGLTLQQLNQKVSQNVWNILPITIWEFLDSMNTTFENKKIKNEVESLKTTQPQYLQYSIEKLKYEEFLRLVKAK